MLLCLMSLGGCDLRAGHVSEVDVEAEVPESAVVVAANVSGSVRVLRGEGDTLQVRARFRMTSRERADRAAVHIRIDDADGRVTVIPIWPGGSRNLPESVDLVVFTPRPLGANISTGNGSISVQDVTGSVVLMSRNGEISLIRAVALQSPAVLNTSNGRIVVEQTQGSIEATTSNGSIEITGVDGRVRAVTSNGAIRITLAPESAGPLEAVSRNGSVHVGVGPGFVGRLNVRTRNGTLSYTESMMRQLVQQPVGRGSMELEFGEGDAAGVTSTVQTSNGNITLDWVQARSNAFPGDGRMGFSPEP
jgi:hypothetical protein